MKQEDFGQPLFTFMRNDWSNVEIYVREWRNGWHIVVAGRRSLDVAERPGMLAGYIHFRAENIPDMIRGLELAAEEIEKAKGIMK